MVGVFFMPRKERVMETSLKNCYEVKTSGKAKEAIASEEFLENCRKTAKKYKKSKEQ